MKNSRGEFRAQLLGRWTDWSIKHRGKALLIILAITIVMLIGISILKTEMTFYSILPENSTQVRDMKTILKEFPAASSIMAVVDAREIDDPLEAEALVKKGIDEIVDRISGDEYCDYVTRVTGKADITFLKEHGLMFNKEKDIERSARMYSNLNLVPLLRSINDDFEREYSGDDDKLADEEQLAVGMFRGLNEILGLIEKSAKGEEVSNTDIDNALEDWLFGDSYILSNDNKMGIAIIQPTFTMDDIMIMAPGINAIEEAVKDIGDNLGISTGLTGIVVVGRDEMATSQQGIVLSTLIALILILLIMIFSFRMFSVPFISGIPLVIGIFWTIGLCGFVIHRLNIMTAMYMVALLGLGIDFAIHILTSYRQERDEGLAFNEAIIEGIKKSGPGIITGGLTTAAAFFALIVADTQMIRELGIVAGLGIISEMFAMFMLIPPLLSFREHVRLKKGKPENKIFSKFHIKSDAAMSIGKILVKAPIIFSLLMLGVGIFFGLKAPDIRMEKNIMKMEAKGLESIKLQDTLVDEFGMAPDSLAIVSTDPAEVKELSESLEDLSSVKMVDSLGNYYVSPQDAKIRGAIISNFAEKLKNDRAADGVNEKDLLDELYRLEMNIMEMGDMAYMGNLNKLLYTIGRVTGVNKDGDKVAESSFDHLYKLLEGGSANIESLSLLQDSMVPILKNKLLKMASDKPVSFEVLPASIRDSYISSDGEKYLINVIPTQNPWNSDFRDIYTKQMNTITDRGTGMILAGDQLSNMAEQDGVKAAIVALVVVFIILLADFRNIKLVLITMSSLLLSFLTLFGFMAIANIKFDFLNIIVVPLLIGIGVDDAVHINHRYLLEGKGKMKLVLGKTGTALLITSLTTIVGFASFIPSIMRAMRSTGIVLSIAMVIAFLFSVLFHPGMLIIVSEKMKLNIKPWGTK